MFLKIEQLLSGKQLEHIHSLLAAGQFGEGGGTAGQPARKVKHNRQLDLATLPGREELLKLLNGVMLANPLIRMAALPRRMTLPLVNKYGEGMEYGWHIDNPVMQGAGGTPLRADLACTIFLSDPQDYGGGELQVSSSAGESHIKLPRGDAFLYPASTRHRVTAISRGERLAIVIWLQSMVAGAEQREMLYELELAYRKISSENPDSAAITHMQRVQANLMRRWADM